MSKAADELRKLAIKAAQANPGTAEERWQTMCVGGLITELLSKGFDVVVVVSRGSGNFNVVTEESRQ